MAADAGIFRSLIKLSLIIGVDDPASGTEDFVISHRLKSELLNVII